MRNILLIARRELRAYFATPVAGTMLALSGLLSALLFVPGDQRSVAVPFSFLTSFRPSPDVSPAPVLLAAAIARLVLLVIVPLIAARTFVEEKQSHTIELLFTSPAAELEIVLGKWLGAAGLFLIILALSPAGLALVSPLRVVDWRAAAATYPALLLPACGLLAIGECLSMSTRHQTVAAAGSIVISFAILHYLQDGVLRPTDYLFCTALLLAGWLLTLRAIRAQRSQPI